MKEAPITDRTADSVEQAMREELARGDELFAAARPVLCHLLAHPDRGFFNEERIARIRGMILDVARQLVSAESDQPDPRAPAGDAAGRQDRMAQALFEDSAFLLHAHALALEAEFAERIRVRSGIDSVLSPLIEDLAADADAATAGLAMAVLAAQARFLQHCRRMELPIQELPGELFHRAMLVLGSLDGGEAAERRLRGRYEEAAGRLALIARLVAGLGRRGAQALSVEYAGVAIFATALATASGQERELAVLSFADGRFARLALALRAAGLDPSALAEQVLCLDPGAALPDGLELVSTDRAAGLLAASRVETVS